MCLCLRYIGFQKLKLKLKKVVILDEYHHLWRFPGAGIAAENLKKVFGQYVQFDAGKLQNGKGSGLGLWICKGIHTGRREGGCNVM